MSRIGRGSLLALALLIGLVPAGGAVRPAGAAASVLEGVAAAAEAVFADEIRGTVTFNGCVVPPAKISMRAVPLGVKTDDGVVFPPGRSAIKLARITATADAHVLAFSIRGLATRTGYQLGISYPPNPCGKMFWRGPEQGLALSGARPVKIEGFAAQTQIELYSRETGDHVGADELEFMEPALATRRLRWRSLIPGVTGGELQLSTEAFPHQGRFQTCDEPETGVFYRQAVPAAAARGRWQTIDPIDFGPLLAPPGRVPPDIPGLTPISARAHGLLLLGAPVYMRVVPVIGDQPACDARQHGVAGWVIAAKRPKGDFDVPGTPPELPLLIALNGQSYAPPYLGQPLGGHPRPGELAYRVIKPHTFPPLHPNKMTSSQFALYSSFDPWGVMLLQWNYAKPGETWNSLPGQPTWFYYVPKSSGDSGNFITDLGSIGGGLVTGTFTAFGEFVDFMAKMTGEIKASLAKAVVGIATVVPGVGGACAALQASPLNTSCEAVVKAGMEYGLASMGLPPSLPNWQELQDQGIEYLAAEVSGAIGDPGVLESFTEQMLHDMVDSTLNKVSAQRPGLGKNIDWLTPYLGYEPAVWKLSVFNTDPNYHPQETYLRVKSGNGLFQEANVHVPEWFPLGGLVHIPVVLQPSRAGIYAPWCRMNRYDQVSCVPAWWAKKPYCEWEMNDAQGTYYWAKLDCSGWDWPDIYYRDAWVLQKLFPNACTTLGAYSASNAGGLWLVNPDPPFIDVARLQTLVPATWDGGLFLDPVCP